MLHLFQGVMLCQVLVCLHILCQVQWPIQGLQGYSYLMSRPHKASGKDVLCGWKWAEELCVFTPAWGQPTLLLIRRAEVGWSTQGQVLPSAGSRAVSKRVMHWKMVSRKSWELLCIGIKHRQGVFCFSWARVEKALLIARLWEEPCKAEPWHNTSTAWFISFNSIVPGRIFSKTHFSFFFLWEATNIPNQWINLNSFSFCLSPHICILVSEKQQSQVFACLPPVFVFSIWKKYYYWDLISQLSLPCSLPLCSNWKQSDNQMRTWWASISFEQTSHCNITFVQKPKFL